MKEYIDREAFLKYIEERYCLPCKDAGRDHNGCKCRACWVDDMRGDVIDAPTADVAPVRHGMWKYYRKQNIAVCTDCGFERDLDANFGRAVSCPNCGAYMRQPAEGE